MTFRCALRFEPDKAKGPGYGLILASCPGFSAAPNTLLYMIKDPSNGMSLGPNGWQPGDAHLVPDAVAPSGEILSLSVGPAVVDSLELQAIYQVVLFTDAEHVWQGGLSINRIVYSRDPSLLPDLELAPKAAPSAGREPLPMPEMETGPAPTSLSFDGKPSSAVPASELLNLKERPKSYKSLILNIIFAILTVILLAGAGYFIYTRVLPKTDTTLEEKPAEVLKHEAADLPPGQEAPVKYAPDDIKGPKGLQVARDALKRKVEPDTAMALAQQLFYCLEEGHDRALGVRRAAAPDLAVGNVAGKRRMRPRALGGHDVLMAHEHDRAVVRPARPVIEQIAVNVRARELFMYKREELGQQGVETLELFRLADVGVRRGIAPDHGRELLGVGHGAVGIRLRLISGRFARCERSVRHGRPQRGQRRKRKTTGTEFHLTSASFFCLRYIL